MGGEKDGRRVDTSDGTDDDWLSVLSNINTSTVPEGYKTANELAAEYGHCRRKIRYILNQKVERGEADVIKVAVDGRIHNAYKII